MQVFLLILLLVLTGYLVSQRRQLRRTRKQLALAQFEMSQVATATRYVYSKPSGEGYNKYRESIIRTWPELPGVRLNSEPPR